MVTNDFWMAEMNSSAVGALWQWTNVRPVDAVMWVKYRMPSIDVHEMGPWTSMCKVSYVRLDWLRSTCSAGLRCCDFGAETVFPLSAASVFVSFMGSEVRMTPAPCLAVSLTATLLQ